MPVTSAVVGPVETTEALPLLLQVPPEEKSLRLMLDPAHTDVAPPIPDGAAVMVTIMLDLQPAAPV